MKELLKQISEKAIALGEYEFQESHVKDKWLGRNPASPNEILLLEKRVGLELPEDYKRFLTTCNGFSSPSDIEPTFESVDKIDFLRNINPHLIESYSFDEIFEIGEQLNSSILVGGLNEEQHFLLIPPSQMDSCWKYWKFANWYPGEEEFEDLKSYFVNVLEFLT